MKYKNSKWINRITSSSLFSKYYFPQSTIIIIASFLMIFLLLIKWLELPITFKPYDYIVINIKVYDDDNKSLKKEFFDEIKCIMNKDDITSQIQIDSTSTSIVLYQKDRSFHDFTDLCIYLNDQTLDKMRSTINGTRNISSSFYVYQLANCY